MAISILAISLVVILQLFSGALKSSRMSDEYTRGIFYAQEKMEEILLKQRLTSGVEEGEFDPAYRWRAEIVRIEQTEEEAQEGPPCPSHSAFKQTDPVAMQATGH